MFLLCDSEERGQSLQVMHIQDAIGIYDCLTYKIIKFRRSLHGMMAEFEEAGCLSPKNMMSPGTKLAEA